MEPKSSTMTVAKKSTSRPGESVNQADALPVLHGTSRDSRRCSSAGSCLGADHGALLLTVGESRRDRIPPPSVLRLRASTSSRTSRAQLLRRSGRDESVLHNALPGALEDGFTAVSSFHERQVRLANRVPGFSDIDVSTSIDATCDRPSVPVRATGNEARLIVSGDRSVTRREVIP